MGQQDYLRHSDLAQLIIKGTAEGKEATGGHTCTHTEHSKVCKYNQLYENK